MHCQNHIKKHNNLDVSDSIHTPMIRNFIKVFAVWFPR